MYIPERYQQCITAAEKFNPDREVLARRLAERDLELVDVTAEAVQVVRDSVFAVDESMMAVTVTVRPNQERLERNLAHCHTEWPRARRNMGRPAPRASHLHDAQELKLFLSWAAYRINLGARQSATSALLISSELDNLSLQWMGTGGNSWEPRTPVRRALGPTTVPFKLIVKGETLEGTELVDLWEKVYLHKIARSCPELAAR